MLTLTNSTTSTCEGINRREVLKLGSLGLGGLTLANLLQLRAAGLKKEKTVKDTAVIQNC